MSNYELRKNAEGYTDPTAAATLSQKETGDIWAYNGGACLIIKNHGKFSTILLLESQEKHPNQVKIMTKSGPMYADQRLITYGLHVKMGRYIETVCDEDLDRALDAIEDALGVELPTVDDICEAAGQETTDQEAAKLLEEVAQLREDLKAMQDLAALKQAAADAAGRAEMKARNQLELLREMYNELLAKAVGGGGW